MSQHEDYKRYYYVLELREDVPFSDVRAAYVRLKELYGGDSIVLSPLEDELSEDWKKTVLGRIEEAYEKLSEKYRVSSYAENTSRVKPSGDEVNTDNASVNGGKSENREEIAAIECFDGKHLEKVRELLGFEIHEVSFKTKIGKQHIKNIEKENYAALPEEVFLRGYLQSCARLYGLETGRVAADYLKGYKAWKQGA